MKLFEFFLASKTAQIIGWALLHSLWQGIFLAALLRGVDEFLRKSRANTRYVLACGVLLLMLTLPVLTALWDGTSTPNQIFGKTNSQANSLDAKLESLPGTIPEISSPQNAIPVEGLLSRVEGQILPWLASVWMLGVLISSLSLLGSWNYTQKLKRINKSSALEKYQKSLERLAKQLRVSRPVILLESSLVRVPTVVGWLKPLILIPPSALTGMSPQQLELIIAHELAHIKRHDYLVNLFQTVVETLLFYHPAAWYASRKIRSERENACDDLAVAVSGGKAADYARALAKLERLRKSAPTLAMAADGGGDGGSLIYRIRRLIGAEETPPAKRFAGLWTMIFIGTFLIAVGTNAGAFSRGSSASIASDSSKRAAANCALGKTGDASAIPYLIGSLGDDEAIAAPVGCWSSGDWSPRLETFKQPSPGEEAAIALASFGKPAIESLVAALNDTNKSVRRNAAWAIGEIRDGDKIDRGAALEVLIALLKDDDALVRRAAAFALSEIKDSRATQPLISALDDEDARVREMAANALGEMKASRAVQVLEGKTNDPDDRVRNMARWALDEIQDR
jgi:beta-lactamase regulating signal transducer with metallopeptidase domain